MHCRVNLAIIGILSDLSCFRQDAINKKLRITFQLHFLRL